jgi:hypothetical protein
LLHWLSAKHTSVLFLGIFSTEFFDPVTWFILYLLVGSRTKCVHFTLQWVYLFVFQSIILSQATVWLYSQLS